MKKSKKNSKINKSRRQKLNRLVKGLGSLALLALVPSFLTSNSDKKSISTDKVGITPEIAKLSRNNDLNLKVSLVGESSKEIKGFGKIYNAVWGDLAEFRPLAPGQQVIPGKVYVETENGLAVATKRAQCGTVGICSDTYGFALGGEKGDKGKVPIGLSGWVLAYVDKKYPIGTALMVNKKGELTWACPGVRLFFPERIVGTLGTKPEKYNNLEIKGRYWVKI